MRNLIASALLMACCGLIQAQVSPAEPARATGTSVTGAFEGWFQNPDGTYYLLLGYYNRNREQTLDIPIGPNNHIDPGGPDRGQPTHFLPGRGWGMFAIKVPADFGQNKLTWTLVVNGKTTVIPVSLHPDYEISPLREAAVGNTPPVLRFEQNGPSVQGPQGLITEQTAKVGVPLPLTVWVSDDAKYTSSSGLKPAKLGPPVTLHWTMYRGPADVTFAKDRPEVEKIERQEQALAFNGKSTTTVTFSQPGDYILHVVANDYSGVGGAGFQCCWTNGEVKVSVQQ